MRPKTFDEAYDWFLDHASHSYLHFSDKCMGGVAKTMLGMNRSKLQECWRNPLVRSFFTSLKQRCFFLMTVQVCYETQRATLTFNQAIDKVFETIPVFCRTLMSIGQVKCDLNNRLYFTNKRNKIYLCKQKGSINSFTYEIGSTSMSQDTIELPANFVSYYVQETIAKEMPIIFPFALLNIIQSFFCCA